MGFYFLQKYWRSNIMSMENRINCRFISQRAQRKAFEKMDICSASSAHQW
jgi:hypothetical protein